MSDAREMLGEPAESSAPWALAPTLSPTAADRVRAWWGRAQHVYPPNTRSAWRCDWAVFIGFCESRGLSPLPASPETAAAFVEACRIEGKKPATIQRHLSTGALAH